MTTAATRFVSTPFGVGVIEIIEKPGFHVRFEDGHRSWVAAVVCTLDVEQPSWWTAPDPRDIPGYIQPETSEIAGWVL
jgi:hypothetical protein